MGMATIDTAAALDAFVLAYVADAYSRVKQYGGREPRIGVSAIVDHIEQHAYQGAELIGPMARCRIYSRVYDSCNRLVKAGKLEASLGLSSRGGEERQYNPAKG